MTHQLCTADHRDNPPSALGGLKLCLGHHAALTEALTGPSAAEDPTIDAAWGVRTWYGVAGYRDRDIALRSLDEQRHRYRLDQAQPAHQRRWRQPPVLLAGDGFMWQLPHAYRPGGLIRDYTALTLRMTGLSTGDKLPYVVHSAEVPLPVPDAVAELRSQIRHDLAYWVQRHAEAGNVLPPMISQEPAQLAVWLSTYTDWAAAQDWAGLYVNVLGELRARARRLIDLPRAPRTPVAPCPEHGCDGVLWSMVRDEHDARPSLVQCNTDEGHQWDSTQWMRLGARLRASGRTAV